jgi:N-acetylneuraminate synthase
VKFQTFKAEKLVSKDAKKAAYQKQNLRGEGDSQFEMLKSLELSQEDHYLLKKYAESKQIKFLSTGFDEESLDFLDQLGLPLFKIPSGEITNLPYLRHIVSKKKPIILSTGMASLDEIKVAVAVMEKAGLNKKNLTVLHCNTEYPTPMQDVNLLAMESIRQELNVATGYSDHTLGIEVPIAAVALGATVIEKHFTLDRNMTGPDHKASLEPEELKAMVKAIRNIELAKSGSGIKIPSQSERANIAIARKSIHLLKTVQIGEIITPEHLVMRRPGDGISPMDLEKVVGRKAKYSIEADTKLTWEQLEK